MKHLSRLSLSRSLSRSGRYIVLLTAVLMFLPAVLPAQRTKFSKRQFTQPQLLAVLCVMRFEDWTFREAEVRLSEHGELRRALELDAAPDQTTPRSTASCFASTKMTCARCSARLYAACRGGIEDVLEWQ